jgi:hypothetical protein
MVAITFDTLEYSKTLQDAGMSQAQADALAQAQKKAFEQMVSTRELATKADLLTLKHDILRWMLAIILAQTALIVAVLAYVK